MKKTTATLLATALVTSTVLMGCSGSGKPAETTVAQTTAAETNVQEEVKKEASSEEAEVNLQIALSAADGSIWAKASQFWAEKAAEYSGGSIKLDVFPSGQLGSQTDIYDQCYAGASVIGVGTPAYFADMGKRKK